MFLMEFFSPCSLLCQPLSYGLVVHRLGFPLALLWFFTLQTGEGVLGTVTVGVCEPIPASYEEGKKDRRAKVRKIEQSMGFILLRAIPTTDLVLCQTSETMYTLYV